MNRRVFPEVGMSRVGSDRLREEGFVIVPFADSIALDPQRTQPHYHEFFQVFLLEGRTRVMHDFVDFTARDSTVVFLSPGQVHTARAKTAMRGLTLSFTQSFFDHDAAPPSRLFEFPFFFPAEARPWLFITKDDPFRIKQAFADLLREFDAADAGASEILRATLRILFVRAHRLYLLTNPPRPASRATQLARQFHLAVERHFREQQSVPYYAQLLGVTANHLHDTVREQTGHAPGELIRRRRLLDAKRLLSHSALSVSEIGFQLGFDDPSYFSRFFRKGTDRTPAEFREKYQRKIQ